MDKVIAYYRVSTERQGTSGLGLEAQQKSILDYINVCGLELVQEFTEVESGKKIKQRPKLIEALGQCKKHKAILLIAKLDRLARNAAFVSALRDAKTPFISVDNPTASKFTIQIQAVIDENESDRISERTKAALAAAKRRGIKLGEFGSNVLSKRNKQKAMEFARQMQPVIERLIQKGFKTVRKLTKALNRQRTKTYTGNAKWHTHTVHTLLKRIEQLPIHSPKNIIT